MLVSYGSRESCSDAPQLVVKSSWSYGAWASQYQLVQGPDGDDDLDGVSNLHEYALGGNPTDPLDTGHAPEYGFAEHGGTEWFTYSHPKRTAADFCLRYIVESSDDLISWETVDTVDVNTNALEPGMDIITNRVPTEGKTQQFIRMVLQPK